MLVLAVRLLVLVIVSFYVSVAICLVALRRFDPPTTAVQTERRIASWFQNATYQKRYDPVPLAAVSPQLRHAAIAAEDERFFRHHGFDWTEMRKAVQADMEDHRERGASTITQQLVRNLFLSTNRSVLRKGLEFSIVPVTEWILTKQRILELYLNVIEWGYGIYGVEAASRYYFHTSAERLTREEAIQLAAVLPAPLRRKPGSVRGYGQRVNEHMRQLGW